MHIRPLPSFGRKVLAAIDEQNAAVPPLNPLELGPSQLSWLREKVPGFADAHDAAERAQIHAAKVRSDTALLLTKEEGRAA